MRNKTVNCNSCGRSSETDDLIKSCGNCFACLGCEIYICQWCGEEIVIKPIPERTD